MTHLGLAVYFWGRTPQNRLLAECLGPAARELRSAGLLDRFWFDRFDSRGPHVFAVFTPHSPHGPELSRRVAERVEAYLRERPSLEEMTEEQVAAHHTGCRGKVQCEADAYPGLAANNTYHVFEHPAAGYPYWLLAGNPCQDEILNLLDTLALWAIDQFSAQPERIPMEPAIRWAAALDRELRAAGKRPAEYWRYHATTLILPLAERLETDEQEVLRSLPRSIGEKNRQTFARLWQEDLDPWPGMERLAAVAAPGPDVEGTPRQRWRLLREIVHIVLKQLGVPVNLHIPLLLFAWNRNLELGAPRSERGMEPA